MIKYRWIILSLLLFATTINYKLPENHKKVDQEELAHIKSDQDFSPAPAENKISYLQLIKHKETWGVVIDKFKKESLSYNRSKAAIIGCLINNYIKKHPGSMQKPECS